MHTAVAFCENITCNAAWNEIKPVPDPTHHIEGDYLYIADFNRIVAIRAGGEKIRRARLDAPSLRALFRHYIHPVCAEDGVDKPLPIEWRLDSPLPLVTNEGLKAEVYSAVGAATTYDYWIGLLLATGPLTPVAGAIYTVPVEFSGTITAKQWSALTLTFAETLPVGRYQVVGMDIRSGSGVMFRLVFPGAPATQRPGGFTHWSWAGYPAFPYQRMGGMGAWGEFDHRVPPQVEILEMGTETPDMGWLDLIKVG